MGRRKFGDQRACSKCGHDVEWHGRAVGWMDRGQGTDCLPTGKYDEDGYRIPAPAGRHMVHER